MTQKTDVPLEEASVALDEVVTAYTAAVREARRRGTAVRVTAFLEARREAAGLGVSEARERFPTLVAEAQHTPQLIENRRSHERAFLLSPDVLFELVHRLSHPVGTLLDQFAGDPVTEKPVVLGEMMEPQPDLKIGRLPD